METNSRNSCAVRVMEKIFESTEDGGLEAKLRIYEFIEYDLREESRYNASMFHVGIFLGDQRDIGL